MTDNTADQGIDGARIDDIRGVLIQVTGARLLMPNAAIAEVRRTPTPSRSRARPTGCWARCAGGAGNSRWSRSRA